MYFLGKFLFLSSLWFDKSAWLQGKNYHYTVNTMLEMTFIQEEICEQLDTPKKDDDLANWQIKSEYFFRMLLILKFKLDYDKQPKAFL